MAFVEIGPYVGSHANALKIWASFLGLFGMVLRSDKSLRQIVEESEMGNACYHGDNYF